ncbi:MAG: GWxTD domain-containing protein [Bacteroidota bacterium]
MKRFSIIVLLVLAPLLARSQAREAGHPSFDALAFAARSLDSTRLDLYLTIPYSAISFERNNGIYVARYQARILVEGNGRKWYDSTFTRTLKTPSYGATIGREPSYEFYQRQVILPAGTYSASIDLLDLRTNIVVPLRQNVIAVDYRATQLGMSSLLLVRKIREERGTYAITPMLSESIRPDDEAYFLFFETYNSTGREKFRIEATYRNGGKPAGTRSLFEKTIPAGRSQQWVRMPISTIPRGIYTVELRIAAADDTSRALATSQRTVRIEGSGNAVLLSEDELAEKMGQLRYVAMQSDIDNIRSAASLTEQQHRYDEFWSRLDPTPGTAENEAMDEYFRRIEYADAHYRSYAQGWLTDMGRAYVIYGQPDNIMTDPFHSDGKAVETWQYYHRGIKLIFLDESGFGDFRFATPLPPGEKYHYGN